ncbi:unnamed protein product [Phaeothamnion confervicola]
MSLRRALSPYLLHSRSLSAPPQAGGLAGTAVDVALYPLDTIKTRLQSAQGFVKAGGFSGIYKGLGAAAVGSAPGAAVFFSTYESAKAFAGRESPAVHMAAASAGEVMACVVRVPTENVKQKVQAGLHATGRGAVVAILKADGAHGFYAGFWTTVMREVPFSLIQFPLYERFKALWATYRGAPAEPYQAAACGSAAGAIAAAITTPLDVVKTRLMLGKDRHGLPYKGMVATMRRIRAEEGPRALLSGLTPRITWIAIGGYVFFGVYETAKDAILALTHSREALL